MNKIADILFDTVRCRYNAVIFLTNIHERHHITCLLGRGMGCLLWIQHLIDILPQFRSCWGYIGFTPSVHLSRIPCPLCYSHICDYTPRTTKLLGVSWFHSVRPSVPHSVSALLTPTFVDGLFPYLAQMITSIGGCVVHNDLWHWPVSFRSFSHDCDKTAKIWHILCPLYSTYSSGSWILSIFGTNDHWHDRVCHTMTFDLDISSWLFSCYAYSYFYILMWHKYNPCFMYHFQVNRSKWRSHGSLELLQSGQGYLSRSLIYSL